MGTFSYAQKLLSYKVYQNDTINIIDKDSLKQGIWKEFWSNGDLKSEVSFKNNKKQGLEISWYDELDCVEHESYYKDGVLDGPSIYYSKKCTSFYEDKDPTQMQIVYHIHTYSHYLIHIQVRLFFL